MLMKDGTERQDRERRVTLNACNVIVRARRNNTIFCRSAACGLAAGKRVATIASLLAELRTGGRLMIQRSRPVPGGGKNRRPPRRGVTFQPPGW